MLLSECKYRHFKRNRQENGVKFVARNLHYVKKADFLRVFMLKRLRFCAQTGCYGRR